MANNVEAPQIALLRETVAGCHSVRIFSDRVSIFVSADMPEPISLSTENAELLFKMLGEAYRYFGR